MMPTRLSKLKTMNSSNIQNVDKQCVFTYIGIGNVNLQNHIRE